MADLSMIDDQELTEREEAAKAYSDEDDKFLVDYANDCVNESEDANKDIRNVWDKCWDAYRNRIDYSDKKDWQSQVVTNDPFTACKRAVAIVRKAFDQPDYFSIEPDPGVKPGEENFTVFTEDMLETWFGLSRAKFPIIFNDAAEMGFAVGQSKEIIAKWVNGQGLVFDTIEPWKIYRDPDAEPRNPWSGMYWVHEDYRDIWSLKSGENGYINLDKVKETKSDDVPEKSTKRKEQFVNRTKYRKATLTRDFWGTIVDEDGEILLPDGHMLIAGDAVISPPERNPFVKMRWPGISFSPFAHLTRFEGRGILEGAIQLWWMQCNLLGLFMDDLNWSVNKMRMTRYEYLDNPADTECVPGKNFLIAFGAPPGTTVIEEVQHQPSINQVLPTHQLLDQKFQNSTMVSQFVSGLPGDRSRVTLGEVDIKRSDNLNVFDSIGYDLELGAIYAILAAYETLMLNWTELSTPSPVSVMGEKGFAFGRLPKEKRREYLEKNLNINVGGISAQIRQTENMQRLMQYVEIMLKAPMLMKYDKPYELNKEIVQGIGFRNPSFLMDDKERQEADKQAAQAEQQMQQMQQGMLQAQMQNEGTKVATDAETKRRKAATGEFKAIADAALNQDQSNKPTAEKKPSGK